MHLKISVFLCLGLLFVVGGCQQLKDNSLLTDSRPDDSSNILNKDPNVDELFLRAHQNTFNIKATQTLIEISGECFPSTYPIHKIVAKSDGILYEIIDLSVAGSVSSTSGSCTNGKFIFGLNTASLRSGANSVAIEIEARDSSGRLFTNAIQGLSRISINKSQ